MHVRAMLLPRRPPQTIPDSLFSLTNPKFKHHPLETAPEPLPDTPRITGVIDERHHLSEPCRHIEGAERGAKAAGRGELSWS